MTSTALVRPLSSVAWELRFAWAKGRRVSLRVDADVDRVEGLVTRVSATGAFAVVGGWHVPIERILAVYRPSRLGDSDFDDAGSERWRGYVPRALRRDPRQLGLERAEAGAILPRSDGEPDEAHARGD